MSNLYFFTGEIFSKWLLKRDRKFQRAGRSVLFFLDNCSAHHCEDIELKSIRLIFLPPNCTSHLQPCDMGIIKNFKDYYRRRLLTHLLDCIEQNESPTVSILQSLRWARMAWEINVNSTTIANCFKKAGFSKVSGN